MNISNQPFFRNDIQFPRIISEILATQNIDIKVLAESMDLDEAELKDLLDRAQMSWESAKKEFPVSKQVNMYVSLDGGISYLPSNQGVRIVYPKVMIAGEDGRGELHINATHEGVITDVWIADQFSAPGSDDNLGSKTETIDDIVCKLVDENQ